jgi:hypothetical protein
MPDPEEWDARYRQLVAGEQWVTDGNYLSRAAARFARADLVVDVRASTFVALRRIVARALRGRGKPRPESAPGCVEQPFSWQFLTFLWWVANFNRRERRQLDDLLAELPSERVAVVRSWVDADALVARLAALR